MAIVIDEVNRLIRFDDPEGVYPALTHTLLAHYCDATGRLIAGYWEAREVPYVADEVAYYLYEGLTNTHRSDYFFWNHQGLAGCWMKQHVRRRLGLTDSTTQLFEALRLSQE